MAEWRDTQTLLQEVGETANVYFQPPTGYKLKYPAIVFVPRPSKKEFADDIAYFRNHCYEVTVIDFDPDRKVASRIEQIPYCSHDRHFKKDNLHHDTFTLYN